MPSTYRIELEKLGFDWASGTILFEPYSGPYKPREKPITLERDDAVLDKVFFASTSHSQIPRIFASDKQAVYFSDTHPRYGAYVRRLPYKLSDFLRDDKKRVRIPHPDDHNY